MTADAKRKLVVQGALSRKGKNTYTQHYEKRYLLIVVGETALVPKTLV